MSEEDQFWLSIWKCITTAVCVAVMSIAGCTANSNYQVRVALESKADPLQVACAFGNNQPTDCAILAAKR